MKMFYYSYRSESTGLATAASFSSHSAGTLDGSRGEWGIFLRASVVAYCWFQDRVYLEPIGLDILVKLRWFLSRWLRWFRCYTLILGCQQVEIWENCEEFGANPKTNLLYFCSFSLGFPSSRIFSSWFSYDRQGEIGIRVPSSADVQRVSVWQFSGLNCDYRIQRCTRIWEQDLSAVHLKPSKSTRQNPGSVPFRLFQS
jgi:hypothetical protein